MHRGMLVARREYVEMVRTKAFWLGLLAFPIIITLAILVPLLLEKARAARTYAVVDDSGFLSAAVEGRVYAEDLGRILRVARRRQREGGREYERLPAAVRELTAAYLDLEEADRETFVEALWRPEAAGRVPGPPDGRTARFLADGGAERLRQWWQQVPATELARLDLKLVRKSYVRVPAPAAGEDLLAELNGRISRGEVFAYFVIGPDPVRSKEGCRYVSNNFTDRDLLDWYGRLASAEIRERRIAQGGVDPQVARWMEEPLSFQDRRVGDQGGEEEVEIQDKVRQWAPVAFTYLLWIAVFTSAQMLLTSTIEEKSARIMEVLLSSVSPFELMLGKIAGVAGAGLTVVASWAFFIVGAAIVVPLATGNPEALGFARDIAGDPVYLLTFGTYFLLGYLFYAAILVGIGSVCTSLKDAQNLMLPVMIPMMVAIFALVPIGRDPNGTLAQVMSFIPPFTPFVMMNRAAGPPPAWQYGATTVLLLAAIWAAVWGAGKIFRVGILMTGKPPSIGQMVRWLTMAEGAIPPQESAG
ncbi:MAG: ABC transporter permease [Gemmatimonadota bacterium]